VTLAGWEVFEMAINYTKNSNKLIHDALRDNILLVAQAYCQSGLLHIGYALHHLTGTRESQYVPADSRLPTLVICSVNKEITGVRSIYDTEHEAVITLKTALGL